MADIKAPLDGHFPLTKLLRDLGDGNYAQVVALALDAPVTLTGDVVLDTFGALDDAKETDPDAASATIPALLRGQLAEIELFAQKLADAISTISPSAAVKVVMLDDNGVHVIGGAGDSPEADPNAGSATIAALIRGLLSVSAKETGGNLDAVAASLMAIAAAAGAASDSAGDPTVIGLLKQIMANTSG